MKQAPEIIREAISRGELTGSFPGAALTADICGFTNRFQGMAGLGVEGAEQLAREVSETLSGVVDQCSLSGGYPVLFAGDAVTIVFPGGCADASKARLLVETGSPCAALPLKTTLSAGQVVWDVIPLDSWTFYSFQGSALSLAAGDGASPSAPFMPEMFPIVSGPIQSTELLPPTLFLDGAVNEFRQVTSIFLSMENRGGQWCPREFQSLVLAAAGEMGGFVSGLQAGGSGQRMLVVFGAPVTREDDPGRADAFLGRVFASASGRVRAGAATGLVFSGTIRTPMLESYTVLGPSVNLAARLHDTASWNSVYGDPVFNGSSRMGVRRELGLRLKGFSSVVSALVLSPWKQRRESRGSTPPLIERDGILAGMENALEKPGAAMLLLGDTGMGKTRLVEELQQRLSDTFFMNLRCRSLPVSGSDVFSSWFGEWLGGRDRREGLPAFKEKLYGFISSLEELEDPSAMQVADELLRAESFLAALVGLGWEKSLYQVLDPQGRFANTVAALAAFIRGHTLLGRTVITVDDLQWISPDSRKVLASVLRELEENRPPVLLLSRPDSANTAIALGLEPEILELPPLSREGSRAFLQWSLGQAPSDALLEWFHLRTEGIPFFMEHYAGMLVSAESPPDEHSFPGSLHALLVARLDRLEPELRRSVLSASILGREFDREILGFLCHSAQADELIERGVRERVWRLEPDGSCSFVHILLREAAYRLQLHGERVPLHARAAEGMARLWGSRPEKYAVIAHHLELADQGPEAADWYIKAGEHSLSRRMNASCLVQMEKVLELSADPLLRLSAHRLLYDLHASSGDIEKARECIERASLEPGDDLRRRAVIRLMRANLAINEGKPREAMEHLDGLEGMSPGLRPDVLHLRGRILVLEGRNDEARDHLLAVYEEFRTGSPEERLLAFKALGNACGCMLRLRDRLEDTERNLKRLRSYARETGNLLMETLCVGNLALAYKYLPGRMKDAMALTREHMELARLTGSRLVELQATGNLGSLMEKDDPSPEAFSLLEKAVELARKYGGGDTASIALGNLASAYGRVGRHMEACTLFAEALEVCREHCLGLHRVDYALEMSNVLMDMGRLDEAEAGIEQVRRWGFPDDYRAYYSCCCGRLLAARGKCREAVSILQAALADATDELERFDLLRQLYNASGDPAVLRECLREGEELQRRHPHWDTEAKLVSLREAVPCSSGDPSSRSDSGSSGPP